MADTEVLPPPVLVEDPLAKETPGSGVADQGGRRDGRPERPRREVEDTPDMTVEEAHKALNALPKSEPQPDIEEHELKVAGINEEIKKIKDQIEVLRAKIDEANEARRGQGDEMGEARAVMRQLKEERDEIRAQLDSMQAESQRAKAALDGHDKTKRALQSSLKYKTVGEIETAIRQMEARQQTSSMKLAEEKKLVKEIEQLKQSKKTAAQYVSTEEAVGKAKDGYGAARKTESEKKAELRAVQDKIKAAFTTLEEMGKVRDEEGGGMSTLFEEKKALHDLINDKIEEIKELRAAHRAKLDQWYNSKRERLKFKRALGRAEYLSRQEAKNARVKALEEEEAKKIPYESEMALCDALVSYLETTFMKGKDGDSDKKAAAAPTAAASAEFGGLKMVMKKRSDEDFIVMGKGKKGRGQKKGGANKGNTGGTIVHAIDTMESFSLLSISAPPNKAAVPAAIEALKEKKTWYSEQPRGTVTAKGKTSQSEKPKAAGKKEKAPEITDEAFPSLPGAAPKPKVEEEGGGEASGEGAQDGEVIGDREVEQDTAVEADANGNGTVEEGVVVEAAAGPTAAEIVVAANVMVKSVEEVEADPTPAESVVNGVNGNAEKVVKGLEAEGEEEKDNQSEEKPAEVEAKEDGEATVETAQVEEVEVAEAPKVEDEEKVAVVAAVATDDATAPANPAETSAELEASTKEEEPTPEMKGEVEEGAAKEDADE